MRPALLRRWRRGWRCALPFWGLGAGDDAMRPALLRRVVGDAGDGDAPYPFAAGWRVAGALARAMTDSPFRAIRVAGVMAFIRFWGDWAVTRM